MTEFVRRNAKTLVLFALLFAILGAVIATAPQVAPQQPIEVSAFEAGDTRTYIGDSSLLFSRGKIDGFKTVVKFGSCADVNSVKTDIWSRCAQPIWVAPTDSRYHKIESTDIGDSGWPPGGGARTVTISGLVDWDTEETTETIFLDGTFPVTTTHPFVCVHRMEVLTKGPIDVNIGTITATAIGDDTVTAQIEPGVGQTQMAIYCIPSVQTAYLGFMLPTIGEAVGVGAAKITILYNPEPQNELLNFVSKSTFHLRASGQSGFPIPFWAPKRFVGPGILKIQTVGTINNLAVSVTFELIVITH